MLVLCRQISCLAALAVETLSFSTASHWHNMRPLQDTEGSFLHVNKALLPFLSVEM
jgi:hypothetical protein